MEYIEKPFRFVGMLGEAIFADPINLLLVGVILIVSIKSYLHLIDFKSSIESEIKKILKLTESFGRDSCRNNEVHNQVDTIFQGLGCLKHSWQEFHETIVEWENNISGENEYYNTQPAADFFNISSLKSTYKSFSLVESAPSVLTGLGIIGTFAGILLSLNDGYINGALNIDIFIGGLKTAFVTSLVGMGSALGIGSILRGISSSIQSRLLELCHKIDRAYPNYKTINLEKELFKNMNAINRSLHTLNEDLPKNIANYLSSNSAIDSITEMTTSAVKTGLNELLSKITETVASHKELNIVSSDMSKVMEERYQEIKSTQELNINALNKSVNTAGELYEKLNIIPRVLDSAAETFHSSAESLGVVVSQVPEFTEKLSTTYSQSTRRSQEINNQIQEIALSIKEISQKAVTANVQTVNSLDKNLNRFDGSLSEALGGLSEIVSDLNDLVQVLHEAKIEQTDKSAA